MNTTAAQPRYRLKVARFKELCEAKKWANPLQAAQGIGVSHTTVLRILSGQMHPGDRFMGAATAAFEVEHGELFERETPVAA